MIQKALASVFVLVASVSFASAALACPGSTLKFHDISIDDKGTVSRSVYVPRDSDGQNGSDAQVKYTRVVRDSVKLGNHDEITLNALPSAVDQLYKIKVRRETQDADKDGIISTTYRITETAVSSFGGVIQPAVENSYLARISGSYKGNGRYVMGCGEVVKMEIDFPTER